MFGSKRKPDKIESMASLFVLGGFVPFDLSITANQGFNFTGCDACILENGLYIVAMLIGGLSLLLKKGSPRAGCVITHPL